MDIFGRVVKLAAPAVEYVGVFLAGVSRTVDVSQPVTPSLVPPVYIKGAGPRKNKILDQRLFSVEGVFGGLLDLDSWFLLLVLSLKRFYGHV